MSRNICLVFTPYCHMKVTILHKFGLNGIYYISQIPVQHNYSTLSYPSMNYLKINNNKIMYITNQVHDILALVTYL